MGLGEITFRIWTPDDTQQLLGWLEERPQMLEYMGFKTPSALINHVTKAMLAPNAVICAATDNGELIGYVAAVNAQPDRSAVVHLGLAPKHKGRGDELMEAGLWLAFESLGLENLIAAVPNTRRGKVVARWDRRFGFQDHDVKLLYLEKETWEGRNGQSSSGHRLNGRDGSP